MRLRCRRDFPAHAIWHELGFIPLDEKPGRSSTGHLLTLWCLTLAPNSQLSLFQAKASDDTLDVVIDAQIFFDLDELDTDKTKPSKALLSDFLIDSLNLQITDELFVEIDRNSDQQQREKSRQTAHSFSKIEYDLKLSDYFEDILHKYLPKNRPSQKSDIRHLAKTAASDVNTFVTRDQSLLKNSEKIREMTKLNILSPTDLIIQLHELSEKQSYIPNRISGFALEWRRLISGDLTSVLITSFLHQGERQGQFREKLHSFLARPDQYECEILRSRNEIAAFRIFTNNSNDMLISPMSRVARSVDQSLFGRFLISDTICKAIENDLSMVKFDISALTSDLVPDLLATGFTRWKDGFVRFCFSRCLGREVTLLRISELCCGAENNYRNMSDLELERYCSPLSLAARRHFLIPIRPGYAISLVDRHRSEKDLFGGERDVLMRWDHVYYRSKTHYKMLQPPARILWYVSGGTERKNDGRQIVAVSHLDAVETGNPKELFGQFKKLGILKWKEIYDICSGDPFKEIMALKFSHTFCFRNPISLDVLQSIFREDQINLVLQSPSRIPQKAFQKLFRLGYPEQP